MSDIDEVTTMHEQQPFLVHMEGPDEIEEFATWAEACTAAHEFNVGIVAYNETARVPGLIRPWAIPYQRQAFEERWAKIMAPEPAVIVGAALQQIREAAATYEGAALQLAMFMQARDARLDGVAIDGVFHPTWEELDERFGHVEYLKDAAAVLGAIAVLGFTRPTDPDAGVTVNDDTAELDQRMSSAPVGDGSD